MNKLDYLKRRLKMYLEAEEAILKAQSYTLDNRTLSRPNLAEVRAAIAALIEEIAFEENKNHRQSIVVFYD